jgi:hypothetical protein
MNRRTFLLATAGLAIRGQRAPALDLVALERRRVLAAADRYLREQPVTITSAHSPRSAGGRHDYFSEGDYWWPDPENPKGPYIQKDGLSNPDNFTAHRLALIRLSLHVPALAAAWVVTKDRRYAEHAATHLRAWFMDDSTRMNPHLLYAQAIHGRVTGRGIGIIDTLHLVEVVRAIDVLHQGGALPSSERSGVRNWFERYLTWMTTHEYGQAERDAKNNHGTCWVLQVAEFARYVGRSDLADFCRQRFKTVIVPGQIAADGSFPEELRRTKPYGYSLFNLDAMAGVCQVLSRPSDDLLEMAVARRARHLEGDGVSGAASPISALATSARRHAFDHWPVRHAALLFGGLALGRSDYVDLWKTLETDPVVDEVVRNFIRQPILWLSQSSVGGPQSSVVA